MPGCSLHDIHVLQLWCLVTCICFGFLSSVKLSVGPPPPYCSFTPSVSPNILLPNPFLFQSLCEECFGRWEWPWQKKEEKKRIFWSLSCTFKEKNQLLTFIFNNAMCCCALSFMDCVMCTSIFEELIFVVGIWVCLSTLVNSACGLTAKDCCCCDSLAHGRRAWNAQHSWLCSCMCNSWLCWNLWWSEQNLSPSVALQ